MHLQFICVGLQSSQHVVSCPSAQGESNSSSTRSQDNTGHQEDIYQHKYIVQTICDILTPQSLVPSSPEVLRSSGGLRKSAWPLR